MSDEIKFKTLEETGGNCPVCEYGKIYKDFSDSNREFPITADAAIHFDSLLREREGYFSIHTVISH